MRRKAKCAGRRRRRHIKKGKGFGKVLGTIGKYALNLAPLALAALGRRRKRIHFPRASGVTPNPTTIL